MSVWWWSRRGRANIKWRTTYWREMTIALCMIITEIATRDTGTASSELRSSLQFRSSLVGIETCNEPSRLVHSSRQPTMTATMEGSVGAANWAILDRHLMETKKSYSPPILITPIAEFALIQGTAKIATGNGNFPQFLTLGNSLLERLYSPQMLDIPNYHPVPSRRHPRGCRVRPEGSRRR